MSDVRTFRASDPADLLALVPGLLGFHPEDSVVLMTVGNSRQPLHARVDLPSDPVAIEQLAHYLGALAARTDLRELVLIVYSEDAGLAEAVLDPLRQRLEGLGADLVCAVRTHRDRWWWIGAPPDEPGTPHDVRSHPFMTQMVVDGTVVLGSRRELADSLVGDDPDEIARIAALVSVADRVGQPGRIAARRRLQEEGRWVRHRVRRFVADGAALDDEDTARLARGTCRSVEVRDVAWAEMTHADATRHVDLWRHVVRRVPLEVLSAPATLLGFAAWLSGNGALAWCAVDRAMQCDPGYSLALLLADVLERGMPPSTWRQLTPESLTLFHG